MKILSIDVGGTFIKSAVIEDACVLSHSRIKTPRDSLESFLDAIYSLYSSHPEAEGIALSMPGILNEETGFMHTGGALYFINEFDLPAAIREKCGDIEVSVANDAKAGALAELELGSLRDINNAVMVVLGTGIGGAIIIDRKVLLGSHRFAGEFSYMTACSLDSQCSLKMWGKMGSGRISELFGEDTSTEEVFAKARENDEKALAAIDLFCRETAVMLSNLQCITDPECITIGGGISAESMFTQQLTKAVYDHQKSMGFLDIGMPPVNIRACTYHDNTMGAWLHFMKQHEKR